MILAAGRGERMGDLTLRTPKPLLKVGQHYLIDYAIANIRRAGIRDIVINVAYQAEKVQETVGDGSRYGVNIAYSVEPERLEVGGGIYHALPLLGKEPFIVVSADVITDYPLERLQLRPDSECHLILVRNPAYHAFGDFGLEEGFVNYAAKPKLTFGNLGLYHPDLFAACTPGFYPWSQVMRPKIETSRVTGEFYDGLWYNIGTLQDLEDINQRAREDSNLRPLASETNTLSS